MRRGFLAAVLVVLAAANFACAGEEPDGSMRFWFDADWLLWWLRPAPAGPATLSTGTLTSPTTAGSGILGTQGSSVLAGNSYLATGPYNGFRLSTGWINCDGTIGADGSFFYLAQRGAHETFSSSNGGSPLLARPIIDARTGNETVLFVSAPGAFNGSFTEASTTNFYGWDANVLLPWIRCPACYPDDIGYYVTPLAGFRYLNLRDDLTMSQSSNVLPGGVGFFNGLPVSSGGNLGVTDDIRTMNQFYGGQIGLKAGVTWWRFTLNGAGKLALGSMRQEANFGGTTTVNNSSFGGASSAPGGLYALSTNSGGHDRNITVFVPEGNLNLVVEITPQVKLMLGYTIFWITDVARPGNLIDRTVNRTELPSSQTFSPAVPGPSRPGFSWSGTDFWAQGINAGLSFRF